MRAAFGLAVLLVCSPALAAPNERAFEAPQFFRPDSPGYSPHALKFEQKFELPKLVPEQPDVSQVDQRRPLLDISREKIRAGDDSQPYRRNAQVEDSTLSPASMHLGPLTVQSGKGNDGRQHLANYSLDGVNILGGSVSGSIDGRGAKVFLRWHPGE